MKRNWTEIDGWTLLLLVVQQAPDGMRCLKDRKQPTVQLKNMEDTTNQAKKKVLAIEIW